MKTREIKSRIKCLLANIADYRVMPDQCMTHLSQAVKELEDIVREPLPEYARFVKDIQSTCDELKWEVEFEQDSDGILFIIISECRYFISPTADGSAWYLGGMIQFHGTRDEPPGEDEVMIAENREKPESYVLSLLDAHWNQIRSWAMESIMVPDDL